LVRERFDWVHLIASEENLGFGSAINLVARRTSSEWLAPANADIALRPGALERMLEAGARDPGAGAIAPRLVLPNGETQHSVFAFPTITFSFLLAIGGFRLSSTIGDRLAFPGHWNTERARRVPWAIAAFLLFRRAAFGQAGGFDERQWMYAEDLDLGWRLKQAGWATRFEPRACVDHESAASTTQLFGPELAPHWQRSTYAFIARRRGPMYARAVALLNLIGAIWRSARLVVHHVKVSSPSSTAIGRFSLKRNLAITLAITALPVHTLRMFSTGVMGSLRCRSRSPQNTKSKVPSCGLRSYADSSTRSTFE